MTMSEGTLHLLDLDPAVELDERKQDGVVVTLLWHRSCDALRVFVVDNNIGDAFEVPVEAGDDPLDVFHHPYAYAAFRGIEYARAAPPAVEDEAVTAEYAEPRAA
jgi:hypothetical protein